MKTTVKQYFDEIKNKRITLIGLGVSHLPVARMLAGRCRTLTVCDKRDRIAIGEETVASLEALGVRFVLGPGYLDHLDGDVIFRSPGVSYSTRALVEARKADKTVTSEMETFFRLCPCRIIGVTGSDGKTTTTTIIAEMLRRQGYTVHLGGNIGKALLPEIESVKPDDYAVVELSSFQLISMRQSPDIAIITNISPNHLDVHKDMQEYIDAKRNIYCHQDGYCVTVLNEDNDITHRLEKEVSGKLVTFSREVAVRNGAWVNDDDKVIYFAENDSQTRVMPIGEIRIPGMHNVENYLAAVSAVWNLVDIDTIRAVAREFPGVEHRIEFVRELDGVKWYNDSIATSPTRTMAGLNSFDRKIIIIAGGYDKNLSYDPLAPVILDKVKTLVLCGATAAKIEKSVRDCPGFAESGLAILHADGMADAVAKARAAAVPGDIVSLSPASASFDQYPNFEARGKHFKEIVNGLE